MKKVRPNNSGITIVALVVSIVVILILAGITIYLAVGNNGIISKAEEARTETIKAEEKTAIELAVEYLKMNDIIENEDNFNANNLEIEIEKNYGHGENSVDVKGENILIVTFTETKNKYIVNADGTIIEADSIEFDLIYYIKKQGTSVDIVLVPISQNENGSAEILCPDGKTINVAIGEERIYTVTESGIYTFTGKYLDHTVTKEIKIDNDSQESVGNIESGDIETKIVPSGITNKNVEVTIINKKTEYTLQYSLDSKDWSDYSTPIIMQKNGPIYVRLAKGTLTSPNYITINITNIDKLPPQNFTPTATTTTNSITLSGSTKDATATTTDASSGIKAYYFSKDNGASWVGGSLSTSYTFTGLTQGKEYNLKMKATDNAGNEKTTDSVSATTNKVTEPTPSNTTFSYEPSTWTKGNVTVKIITTVEGYTLQYSTNGTNWINYDKEITKKENGPIYARIIDSTGQTSTQYVTGNVANIDKLPPQSFKPTATSFINSITILGSTNDAAETSTNGSSGIKAYYFSKDNGSSWVGGTLSTNYTFSDLNSGSTYNLKMKAVDNAGNEIITETISQQTLTPLPQFSYTGEYEILNDDDTEYVTGNPNWKIKFLTSGTLTMQRDMKIDAFLVGGGASGGGGYVGDKGSVTGGSGGPGYSETYIGINLAAGTSYDIVVGNGGTASGYSKSGSNGETTTAFGKSVAGGNKGTAAGWGGNGSNGTGGTEKYEFDEYYPASTIKYSVRGGGKANTGASGKGGYSFDGGGAGGSGTVIIRNNRTIEETVPITFSYTGNYEIVNDDDTPYTAGNPNWKIKLLTSGTFKFTKTSNFNGNIDVFMVGGGASGGGGYVGDKGSVTGGSGGPGYNETYLNINILTGAAYDVVIGSGGVASEYSSSGSDGGTTTAFGRTAMGGKKGGSANWLGNGSNGDGGQETYAFGNISMGNTKYSVNGGGNRNTGNSGYGGNGFSGGSVGGSGIVIIRNKR